jgi:tRNA threonylcarbamoyladenosine biosynthesis protein TsaB
MLLAMDTCGDVGSAALVRLGGDGVETVAAADLVGKTYSALLIPTIWELLEAADTTIQQIEAMVVVSGPGSFTGMRVGLSAAKGLAEAAGLPVIAVSRLAVLARQSSTEHVCAVLDAGRGEVYAGEYRRGVRVREALVTPDQLGDWLADGARLVVCEERVLDRLAGFHPERVPAPTAAAAARAGAERFAAGDFDDVTLLDANYLRRSDAEIFGRKATADAAR